MREFQVPPATLIQKIELLKFVVPYHKRDVLCRESRVSEYYAAAPSVDLDTCSKKGNFHYLFSNPSECVHALDTRTGPFHPAARRSGSMRDVCADFKGCQCLVVLHRHLGMSGNKNP